LIDSHITNVCDYAMIGNRKTTYVKGDPKNMLFKEVCSTKSLNLAHKQKY